MKDFTSERRNTSAKSCDKWFSLKGTLQKHERYFARERSYHCKHVISGFLEKRDIQVRVRFHTGEKPYQCKICENCFYSEKRYSNP